MCGRFNLQASAAELVEIFELSLVPQLQPHFNIAPGQPVLAIRETGEGREPVDLRWGLVPSWSRDPAIGSRMINARGETVATKPAFRSAFRRRRCLIPANGFYEWQKTGNRTKQPFHIGMRDGRPFAFAGLWEHWEAGDGSLVDSCTIITTDANARLADIHHRMPVILGADDYGRWLHPELQDPEALQSLLVPYADDEMHVYPVSTVVNNSRNNSTRCVDPI